MHGTLGGRESDGTSSGPHRHDGTFRTFRPLGGDSTAQPVRRRTLRREASIGVIRSASAAREVMHDFGHFKLRHGFRGLNSRAHPIIRIYFEPLERSRTSALPLPYSRVRNAEPHFRHAHVMFAGGSRRRTTETLAFESDNERPTSSRDSPLHPLIDLIFTASTSCWIVDL